METLRLLVQNLIIIVILAVLMELLLPNGEMRRYTKMVMGLMVIVAVVQAISGLTGGNLFRDMEEHAWRSDTGGWKPPDIIDQGRKLDAENRKQAVGQYKKGIERQISALLGTEGKVRLVDADLQIQDDPAKKDFGKIQGISLWMGRDGGVRAVEPVSVTIGGEKPAGDGAGGAPPEYAGAAARAVKIVSGFYNLPEEQVKVRYRE